MHCGTYFSLYVVYFHVRGKKHVSNAWYTNSCAITHASILSSPTMCSVWHPHKSFGPFFRHHVGAPQKSGLIIPFVFSENLVRFFCNLWILFSLFSFSFFFLFLLRNTCKYSKLPASNKISSSIYQQAVQISKYRCMKVV